MSPVGIQVWPGSGDSSAPSGHQKVGTAPCPASFRAVCSSHSRPVAAPVGLLVQGDTCAPTRCRPAALGCSAKPLCPSQRTQQSLGAACPPCSRCGRAVQKGAPRQPGWSGTFIAQGGVPAALTLFAFLSLAPLPSSPPPAPPQEQLLCYARHRA